MILFSQSTISASLQLKINIFIFNWLVENLTVFRTYKTSINGQLNYDYKNKINLNALLIQKKDSKLTNDYFVHLRLTDILNMHEIQSILLKFWHLAYTFDIHKSSLASKINFSNCFIYEMDVNSYKQFFFCINEALKSMINYKNFNVINNYLSTTNSKQVSYETFGLHVLQIFGNLIKQLNENQLLVILRRVYFAISKFDNFGKAFVKNIQDILPIQVNDIFSDQSRLRSRSTVRTPTKILDENDDHLPSLLDSLQKIDTRTSNSKRQQRIQNMQKQDNHYENLESQQQNFKDDIQENQLLKNSNNQQYPNNNSSMKNNTNIIQSNGVSYSQFNNQLLSKTKIALQTPSQQNQDTLTNQNSNFQEFFQPYHLRPQTYKKLQAQKDKSSDQEGLGQQNSSFSQQGYSDYKQRSQSYHNQNWSSSTMKNRFDRKVQAIQDNNKIRRELNNSFSACYPLEEKMKQQQKANLSSFILGGYDIIDYSDTINKLHRKLLRKIVLNR